METHRFDVIVVGGGAAGLTAALFASRRGYRTLVITQDIGGQAGTTPDIENYPGIDFTDGFDLMSAFKGQAEKYGSEIRIDTVTKIEPAEAGKEHTIFTNTYTVSAPVVILAFGLSHRHLNVPGEKEFVGKGVSYCAVCETHIYKNRSVGVIGGGSSAVQSALILSQHAQDVVIINTNPELRAEAVVMKKMDATQNISVLHNRETKEIIGNEEVTGVVVLNKETNTEENIPVSRVFVEIGYMAKTDWIKDVLKTDERNQIIITDKCETSVPGIFAAGDITTIAFKQVVISAGEGAKAALSADQYVLAQQGKRGVKIDWGRKKK